MKNTIIISFVLLTSLMVSLSCSKGSMNEGNPVLPELTAVDRCAQWFEDPIPLFDNGLKTADVDTASVVWGFNSTYSGEIVEFQDGTEWAIAVALQERDPEYVWGGYPEYYLPASYPVVQFLSSDGSTLSDVFQVQVIPAYPYPPAPEEFYCFTPKVDCTYTSFSPDYRLEVVVTYRYGSRQYSWYQIEHYWDIRVTRMWFVYHFNLDEQVWRWDLHSEALSDQLVDYHMQYPYSGQTHPDIAIDQASGDIYCAWTDLTENSSNLYYKRFRNGAWSLSRHTLKYNTQGRRHDPWYVNLDIGIVDGLPDVLDGHRVVGFAYTGNFYVLEDEEPPLWGLRPVVGYWDISGGAVDADHPAQVILVHPSFIPDENAKYNAGLPVIDIPPDDVDDHGAALAFVQDEEYPSLGSYEVYGISTLDYSAYTHISVPEDDEFAHGTLPSIAVHKSDGTMASVTYFAKPTDGDWAVYATLWTLDDAGVIANPTEVDTEALGEFEMDVNDFLYHDWGTASSLVLIGDYDSYWATWSDKIDAAEPVGVKGAMGYTEDW